MNYSCSSLIQTLLSVPEFWLMISHRISRFTRVADFTAGREFWFVFSHPAPKNFLLHDCIIYLTLWDCNIKLMKISIYRYNFPGIISDGRCHPYAGNVILLRFLFRACAYLPPAAQTRLRLRQWALMVAACLHVITKASQASHILCTWMASFLCYFRHSFFLYIWFSLFILQWCPPGRAPRESPASPAASPLPQIKSGEGDERKNSSQEIL